MLLLIVFLFGLVAQFVKPVGDALEGKVYLGGALLGLVGYLLYAEVQRLNSSVEEHREVVGGLRDDTRHLLDAVRPLYAEVERLNSVFEDQRQVIGELREETHHLIEISRSRGAVIDHVQLGEILKDAVLAGNETTLSALAFTGETFVDNLKAFLERLPENPSRRITIRVLVPDFTKPISVPGRVRPDGMGTDAPGFREKLVAKISDHETRLRDIAQRMDRYEKGLVSVEFRALHKSPELKLYVINDDQVCEGIYDKVVLGPSPSARQDGEGQRLDLIGFDSELTHWRRDDGVQARKVVDRRIGYFNAFWNVATPWTSGPEQ